MESEREKERKREKKRGRDADLRIALSIAQDSIGELSRVELRIAQVCMESLSCAFQDRSSNYL